jgi:4-amino-4-deoxy-L-arabinose transferase-like glycosyltransferase
LPQLSGRTRMSLNGIVRSTTAAVATALLVRIALMLLFQHYEDRSKTYLMSWGLEALMVAHSVATGHGFASGFPHYPFVTGWVAPVYPWLIAFGESIFRLGNHNLVIFGQVVNILFSALTCYPTHYLGTKVFEEKIGLAAAWFWAFSPTAALMPIAWVWDQSLSALILTCLLCYTYWLRESCSPLHWSGYGLLWSVAALTNPTLCILLPFVGVWLWFQRRKYSQPQAVFFARATLFFVLAVLPWTLRNWFELGGHLTFIKTNFGVELWLGNNPDVKDVYTPQHHPMEDYREYRLLVLTSEPFYSRLKQRDAIAFIRANPKTFLILCTHRFEDTWTGVYDAFLTTYFRSLAVRKIFVAWTGIFSLVSFAGMLVALRRKFLKSLPLALCLIVFPIPYYITHSSLRYRHPIDPIMHILAVVALAWFGSLFRSRKTMEAAFTVGSPDHETEALSV